MGLNVVKPDPDRNYCVMDFLKAKRNQKSMSSALFADKNLLDEIDFIKSKINERPIYFRCTWSRCGGASFCELVKTTETFDKIIERYRPEHASKWNFSFTPNIYTGTPKEILDIIWDKYNSDLSYYLISENPETLPALIEDFFHSLWSWDKLKKNITIMEVNTFVVDLEAFMPNESNEVVTGSY
jgi:hypothetical protein